jgi:hypothetical protein
LIRCEHAPRREQRFHLLLLHLSSQSVHLIKFLHDRIMIRIIRSQQFAELNVPQLDIRVCLHRSFLLVDTDLMQACNLLVGKTQILAHAGIFSHAQKVLTATKSVPAAALPAHSVFTESAHLSLATEFAKTVAGKSVRAVTPLMLAFPRADALWGGFLSPTDHRCPQQHQKT